MAASLLKKILGTESLKAGVELAQDYLRDNKRYNNQIKHVISSREVKRGGPPWNSQKDIYS